MTAKLLTIKYCTFKSLLSCHFPGKIAPTLQNCKLYFYCRLTVSDRLSMRCWQADKITEQDGQRKIFYKKAGQLPIHSSPMSCKQSRKKLEGGIHCGNHLVVPNQFSYAQDTGGAGATKLVTGAAYEVVAGAGAAAYTGGAAMVVGAA